MSKKINVVYVVSTLKKCGPTNQLFGIIKHLNKNRFEITVLTLFNEDSDSDMDRFISNGINVDSLFMQSKINYFKIIKKLRNYFVNREIKIIHSSGLAADFCCCFIPSVNHISTIRNYAYYDYISAYGKFIGKIMIKLNEWAIEHTDYPICCSKSIMSMYQKTINNKIHYIRNGVDVEKYGKIKKNAKNYQRRNLELPENKLLFIVSGSLVERKDPLFIINNFKNMNISDKASLILIGDGKLYDQCKKYESDSIFVLGSVSNVSDYLQAADVYISASKSEGLPNSVLEAGACGLEIVLSDIPQHKEIFDGQIHLAHFFELNNNIQFSYIVSQILQKQKGQFINASEYIISNYSAEMNSNKYASFYEFAMNNGGAY